MKGVTREEARGAHLMAVYPALLLGKSKTAPVLVGRAEKIKGIDL